MSLLLLLLLYIHTRNVMYRKC